MTKTSKTKGQKSNIKIDTKFIKYQLMKYWRFDRNYTFCVSECINKSDINAISPYNYIECEIKVSKSDFLHEFAGLKPLKTNKNDGKSGIEQQQSCKLGRTKKGVSAIKTYKHQVYSGKKSNIKHWNIPNFYYFCVPEELKEYVAQYLKENYPNYGLLVCSNYRQYGQKSHIYSYIKPKAMHKDKPSDKVWLKIGKRLQSEFISHLAKEWQDKM